MQTQKELPLPFSTNNKPSSLSSPIVNVSPAGSGQTSSTVEAMDVEVTASVPTKNPRFKENNTPTLLPFLTNFFDKYSHPCPHTNKKTMPHSLNRLHRLYNSENEKPCRISLTCFRRIWKKYFKKNYLKTRHRDGLCQMCEIGHKLTKISEQSSLSPNEKKKILEKLNIVRRHHESNKYIKGEHAKQLQTLPLGAAMLTMDFKENITLGSGPRELGQSWYTRERRTIFGMALNKKEADGSISKWHFNIVSDCLAHDAIFVKQALTHLFATKLWDSFKIEHLYLWCDNAPHFRNTILLAYLLDLVKQKEFQTIKLCFFEAYHGKSEVDGMFGTMTNWVANWKKTQYINTTADLLQCFQTNNFFMPTPARNFFYELKLAETLWTSKGQQKIGGKFGIKSYNFFKFDSRSTNFITTFRLTFRSNRNTTGVLECTGARQGQKAVTIVRTEPKTAPKYSKDLALVNSASLTAGDEELLAGKAHDWGLAYNP